MSKKNRRQQQPEVTTPPPSPPTSEGFRRGMLGIITALVVARPLVLGEDPGMLNPLSDSAPLMLSFFWVCALLAWAIWRYTTQQTAWYGGFFEAMLLLAAVAVALSSYIAPYKHPALLVSWEWLTLFFALILLRQLFTRASDQRHLVAALMATAVMLSAYAIFQVRVEFDLPAMSQAMARPNVPQIRERAWAATLVTSGQSGVLPLTTLLDQRTQEGFNAPALEDETTAEQDSARYLHGRATFSHPSSFAAFLVLLLPAMIVATALLRRQGGTLQSSVALGAVILTVAGLWMTHSRSAFMALAIAGSAGILIGAMRAWLPLKPGLIAAAALAVLAVALGSGLFGGTGLGGCERLEWRAGIWNTAWAMIRAHPWLGVGAGNFGRASSRYLEMGNEPANEPHSFVLELWATYGILALIAVLVAIGVFFWTVLRELKKTEPAPSASEGNEADEAPGTRWEFYIGGIVGLLIAFAINQSGQSPDQVMRGGGRTGDDHLIDTLIAAFRGIIWFAAFALFEGVRWPGKLLPATLAVGVGAALLLLGVSGGISYPSVAMPLWLVMGLALCALTPAPWKPATSSPLSRMLPLPLAFGFFLAYVIFLLDPVMRGANEAMTAVDIARTAQTEGRRFPSSLRSQRKPPHERVLESINNAVKDDPGNARWHLHQSKWYLDMWATTMLRDPKSPTYMVQAINAANQAARLDRYGPESWRRHLDMSLLFVENLRGPPRRAQMDNAVKAMIKLSELDPTNPQIQYRLAKLQFEAGDNSAAFDSIENAQQLDVKHGKAPRKLTPWQRENLKRWLEDKPPETPSPLHNGLEGDRIPDRQGKPE